MSYLKKGRPALSKFAQRFYAKGQEPSVFVNKYTKVICQGMTGKHVGFFTFNMLLI